MNAQNMIKFSQLKEYKIMDSNFDIFASIVFKRLKGKTQLFSPNTNDGYYNRMTHTLQVLAVSMKLVNIAPKEIKSTIDVDVVQRIALCHDLGHTPFGHAGERTLHDILSGKDRLGGLISANYYKNKKPLDGFRHNIYSAKLYLKFFLNGRKRINDTKNIKIIDGILKHTKPFYDIKEVEAGNINYGIDDITKSYPFIKTKEDYNITKVPLFFEGSIVALADEIAQRCSDTSDALLSKIISYKHLENKLPDIFKDKKYKDIENTIVCHFVNNKKIEWYNNAVLMKEVAQKQCDELDKLIKDSIQNSYLIRTNDIKNSQIIRQVFKALYKNPAQLDDATLVNIYSDCLKQNLQSIKQENKDGTIDTKELVSHLVKTHELIEKSAIKPSLIKIETILIKNIAFYIANCTDLFLYKKYKKLYGGEDEIAFSFCR